MTENIFTPLQMYGMQSCIYCKRLFTDHEAHDSLGQVSSKSNMSKATKGPGWACWTFWAATAFCKSCPAMRFGMPMNTKVSTAET